MDECKFFQKFNMDTTLLVFNEKKVLHKEKRTENWLICMAPIPALILSHTNIVYWFFDLRLLNITKNHHTRTTCRFFLHFCALLLKIVATWSHKMKNYVINENWKKYISTLFWQNYARIWYISEYDKKKKNLKIRINLLSQNKWISS